MDDDEDVPPARSGGCAAERGPRGRRPVQKANGGAIFPGMDTLGGDEAGHRTGGGAPALPVPALAGGDLSGLLRATSRTFALGIELLRRPLQDQVRAAYLALRVSDYLEDNRVMAAGRKSPLLRLWSDVLVRRASVDDFMAALGGDATRDPAPDARAARAAPRVVGALDGLDEDARAVIARHASRSTLGMARWAERGPRFDDEADLDDYMHEVAGRVGHLLTGLFALRSARVRRRQELMMEPGRQFGLGLQTVNVVRGLSADRERGWVFVPRSFLPRGMAPAAIFRAENRKAAMDAVGLLADKADRHFEMARSYVRLLPRTLPRVRLFCQLPLFFGVRTLAASRADPAVLAGEVKISRADVRAIKLRATWFGTSNGWMQWYCERLAAGGRSRAVRSSGAESPRTKGAP